MRNFKNILRIENRAEAEILKRIDIILCVEISNLIRTNMVKLYSRVQIYGVLLISVGNVCCGALTSN